jgi:group I intron endonuclease
MKSGIYIIKNLETGHCYIGQSVNLKYRVRRHRQMLRDNKHENDYMQKHYNKYGGENFSFSILEPCILEKLDEREIHWINYYKTMNRSKGYNLESGGNNQKIVSDEIKNKKRGRNNPMYGKKWNDTQRTQIPLANRANSKKLTEYDVIEIKTRINNGTTRKQIAQEYNLHISTVSKITKGINWYWVLPDITEDLKKYRYINNEDIIKLFKSGNSKTKICTMLNANFRKVDKVLKEYNAQVNTEAKHI